MANESKSATITGSVSGVRVLAPFTWVIFVTSSILVALAPTVATANSPFEIHGVISHAPSRHGGDTNGAFFLGAALASEIAPEWLARLHLSTGMYKDQDAVGRARFTLLRVDLRRFLSHPSMVRPFLEVSPLLAFAHFSPPTGFHRRLPGIRFGAGARIRLGNRIGMDISGSYMRSSGATDYAFDVPPRELDGLDEFMVSVEPHFRFHQPRQKD